ncbi:MAG: hypothetical protein ACJ72N_05130 [Labedaea sp.]
MLTTVVLVMNRVPYGLAAMLGAGILGGLAPAAGAAGNWSLLALGLAGLLAVACGLSPVDSTGPPGTLGRLVAAVAITLVFGRYVLPAHPVPAALGLLAVAVVLTMAGFRPGRTVVVLAVCFVLAVLAVVVAACLAIAPAPPAVEPASGSPGTDDPAGLPLATLLLFFAFLGFDRAAGRARRSPLLLTIGVALAGYLAVAGAALRQLGGPRLAVSPAPLRDALAAADASGLTPLLTAGVLVASLFALLDVLAGLRRDDRPLVLPLAAAGAAGGVLLFTVPVAMGLSAGLLLVQYASATARLRGNQDQHERRDGQQDGDHEGRRVDVPREELPGVAAVPPDRPPDTGAEPEQDAEPAEPAVAEQDEQAGQQRGHGGHRGHPEVRPPAG